MIADDRGSGPVAALRDPSEALQFDVIFLLSFNEVILLSFLVLDFFGAEPFTVVVNILLAKVAPCCQIAICEKLEQKDEKLVKHPDNALFASALDRSLH